MTAHAPHSRRPYLYVFLTLVALTIAELGVVYVPGIARGLLIGALIFLAIAKAGLVLIYFMHLGSETRALKLTVLIPFSLPAMFALVLISEAALPPGELLTVGAVTFRAVYEVQESTAPPEGTGPRLKAGHARDTDPSPRGETSWYGVIGCVRIVSRFLRWNSCSNATHSAQARSIGVPNTCWNCAA